MRLLSRLLAGSLFLAAVGACWATDPIVETGHRSHRPLDDNEEFPSLEESLAQRLHRSRDSYDTQKVIRDLLGGRWSERELRALQAQVGNNPELRKRMEEELRTNPELRKQIEQAIQERKAPSPEQLKDLERRLRNPTTPGTESKTRPGSENPTQPTPTGRPTEQTKPQPEGHGRPAGRSQGWLKGEFARAVGQMAEALREQSGNSETLREAMHQLGRLGLDSRFRVNLPALGAWLPRNWARGLNLPAVGRLEMPEMPSIGGGGSWSPPAAPGGGLRGGAPLLAAAAAVVLILLAWKGRDLFRDPADAPQLRTWMPGDWPVRPEAVTTRQQLVAAFEYLACRLLGPSARQQNHRELAGRLGEESRTAEGRTAAVRLADLYEKARYAPEAEPLAPEDLAAARHDLSLLAGRAAP
jgi:hypothetical protein